MMEALAILGYVVGIVGFACAIGMVVCRFEWTLERDDAIARAASGMDEFSAPEGGQRHD